MRKTTEKKRTRGTGAAISARVKLGAGIAVAATGVAAFTATPPAHAIAQSPAAPTAATPQWRIAYRSNSGFLYSVTALSRDNAWAVGERAVLHWQGTSWKSVRVPGITSRYLPTTVAASAPSNVWIFGQGATQPGEAHVWNGKAWRTLSLPDFFAWGRAAVLSASNVWDYSNESTDYCAFAASRLRTCLFHWNGSAWRETDLPGRAPLDLASAGGHAWFLTSANIGNSGAAGSLAVHETASGGLRKIPGPHVTLGTDIGLAAAPNGQLWLSGRLATAKQPPVLFHWTGAKWARIAVPASFYSFVSSPLVFDDKTGVWYGPFVHWTGTRWINANTSPVLNSGAETFYGMTAIPGSASAWAVGGFETGTNFTLIGVYGALP